MTHNPLDVSLLHRHNTYLQECTGQREPTYQLNIHDTKLLFLRFATEQSFSVDTGGGGRESNIHLIPYIIHTVLYVLNTYVPFRHHKSVMRCSYYTQTLSCAICQDSGGMWRVFLPLISLHCANCVPAVQGRRLGRRRICRVSRSSHVRSGWRARTTWRDHTISPSWPCTSCPPNAGGVHVSTSYEDSWSPHTPARSRQSAPTSTPPILLFYFLSCCFTAETCLKQKHLNPLSLASTDLVPCWGFRVATRKCFTSVIFNSSYLNLEYDD